jgi:glycosyltransferase involved in cell wall biosynthesis
VPRVSVITPAYNVEAFLPTCIESVLQQTEHDLELLIVDDGSTDGTRDCLAEWRRRDPRVHAFFGPNRGVSHARNTAMQHASGQFIAFLDADDEWMPTFLAEQLALFARLPHISVVSGNALNRGSALDGRPARAWPSTVRELTLCDMFDHDNVLFVMSVFRRDVYDRIGGLDETLRHSEDYEFWVRTAMAGFRFLANPAPLGWYRRRADSASANELAMFDGALGVFRRILTRLPHDAVEERAALERQIDRYETERLITRAKQALKTRRFADACMEFDALYARGRRLRFALASAMLKVAPEFVHWAYKVRVGRPTSVRRQIRCSRVRLRRT